MDEVQTFTFGPEDSIPNSEFPLLFAKGVFRSGSGDAIVLLEENGWTGTWVFTVYPFWHFHTEGHEVLIGIRGTALIGFGGERGIEVEMKPGDLALIPAGVGHKRVRGDSGFQVAGGYPPGQSGNIVRPGELGANEIEQTLKALALPQTDPLTGQAGGLLNFWRLIAG